LAYQVADRPPKAPGTCLQPLHGSHREFSIEALRGGNRSCRGWGAKGSQGQNSQFNSSTNCFRSNFSGERVMEPLDGWLSLNRSEVPPPIQLDG
jgi:hypothetical protein